MKKRLHIIYRVIWWLTILMSFGSMFSGLALIIDPIKTTIPQFFGLAFPILFIINALGFIFWLTMLNKRFLLPLIAILVNLLHASKYIQSTKDIEPNNAKSSITLGSLNCQSFGHWQGREFMDTVLLQARNLNLDILCLQEAYIKGMNRDSFLGNVLVNTQFNDFKFSKLEENRPYGMLILSKYKILNVKNIDLEQKTGNMLMAYTVLINNDTVQIFNMHLQSFRLDQEKYSLKNEELKKTIVSSSKSLFYQMSNAYKARVTQTRILKTAYLKSKFPTIVCGDLNDVPMSYAYQLVLGKTLVDTYREGGDGMETTYKNLFPSLRIDYIFHTNKIKTLSYSSLFSVPSDHKLIMAKLEIN